MTTQHALATARGWAYWEFGVKAPSLPDPVPVGRRYAEILAAATPGGQVMARRRRHVSGHKGCGHQADETVGERG